MSLLKSYWYAIKNGEDFDKFSKKQLSQVWLFNYIGIIFNGLMFWWLDIFLKWMFFIVTLFYVYRWWCFKRYSKEENLHFGLSKK